MADNRTTNYHALENGELPAAGESRHLHGAGPDGRTALASLLAGLAATSASTDGRAGEIAVPFRANGRSLAEVTAAAVAAVLEQQETHALMTTRVDLDGWLTTTDGIQAWGVVTGVPDSAPPSLDRGDVLDAPQVTTEPSGVTISVALGPSHGGTEPAP